jgi:uncharacterized protein (DUF1330 family)
MPFDMTVGLFVTDPDTYTRYRTAIAPLLQAAGGAFQYDFEIGKTLKSAVGHDINRLFILRFPNREAKESFFHHHEYQAIRARLFVPAVRETTIIDEHDSAQ